MRGSQPWRLILPLLIALVGVLPVVAAPATNEMTGIIHVVHGDPVSPDPRGIGSAQEHIDVFSLVDAKHVSHQLELTPEQASSVSEGMAVTISVPSSADEKKPLPVEAVAIVSHPVVQEIQPQSGNQKRVNLLCAFPDVGIPGRGPSYFSEAMQFAYPQLGAFWRGLGIDISGSDTLFKWVILPLNRADYLQPPTADPPHYVIPRFDLIERDCVAAALPFIGFERYQGINFVLGGDIGCCFWGGRGLQVTASDGVTRSYGYTLSDATNWAWLALMRHEMGHSMPTSNNSGRDGLAHESSSIVDPPGPGNIVDTMSKPAFNCNPPNDPKWGCAGQGTTMPQLARLGSALTAQRRVISSSEIGSFDINLDYLYETSGTNAVQVQIDSNFSVNIEARRGCKDNPDKGLCGAVDGVAVMETKEILDKNDPRGFQDLLQVWNAKGPAFQNFIGQKGDELTVRNVTVKVLGTTSTGLIVHVVNRGPMALYAFTVPFETWLVANDAPAGFMAPDSLGVFVQVDRQTPVVVVLTRLSNTAVGQIIWTGPLPSQKGSHVYSVVGQVFGLDVPSNSNTIYLAGSVFLPKIEN